MKTYLPLLAVTLLCSCATVEDLMQKTFESPKVSVAGVKINALSFESISLLFDLKIENPNLFGLNLAGFDYDLQLNNSSFVKGNRNEKITIKAEDEGVLQLPVTLNYGDIYKAFYSFKYENKTKYKIDMGFAFNVPVLGIKRIPLSHEGQLPLPKFPTFDIAAIKLNKLTASGAELELNLVVDNPNSFTFILKKLNYSFDVADKNWIQGQSKNNFDIASKNKSTIKLPISLNFFDIGSSVFQLLNSGKDLNYHFRGDFILASSLPLMGEKNLPFDKTGRIPLSK